MNPMPDEQRPLIQVTPPQKTPWSIVSGLKSLALEVLPPVLWVILGALVCFMAVVILDTCILLYRFGLDALGLGVNHG